MTTKPKRKRILKCYPCSEGLHAACRRIFPYKMNKAEPDGVEYKDCQCLHHNPS